MSAAELNLSARIARLVARHQLVIRGDVHQHCDCHRSIIERWSYGEHAGWVIEHDGYIYDELEDAEDRPFSIRFEAEVVLVEHLEKAIAEAARLTS